MKAQLISGSIFVLALGFAPISFAQQPQDAPQQEKKEVQVTKQMVAEAIAKGNEFLKSKQAEGGYWTDAKSPGITGLVLSAWMRAPQNKEAKEMAPHVIKGYDYLLKTQKPDGGIYEGRLASYMTSVSLMALLDAKKDEWTPQMLKARAYIVGQQIDNGEPGKVDDKFDGGIGYGGPKAPKAADLSNTAWALEALNASRHLVDDNKNGKQPDLDWDAAVKFITHCQNLPETNDLPWAKNAEEKDVGGFVYTPETSRRGHAGNEAKESPQKVALRSYGSMSYSGLESLIFAKLGKEDKRVKAVIGWLGKNYTIDENPGMGSSGQFYYYHSMAKSLTAAELQELLSPEGKKINWRQDLIKKAISLQKEDGSWVNTDGRWWENDPVIVTAYMILALEQIYPSLN